MNNGLFSGSLVNYSDCKPKSSDDSYYNKTYYVWNKPCNISCLGTIYQPFDSLLSALIYIHNVDMAEKYFQQDISIKLLGSQHFVRENELLYIDMRFFRRMNATIKIGPVFCEEEFILGCSFGLRQDKVDLIFKTDAFNFEISNKLILYNVNLLGNDIVLPSSSQISCFNNTEVCCTTENFSQIYLDSECGLLNRTVDITDKSKLIRVKGLFHLRPVLAIESNEIIRIPSLNLTNVNIVNFHSLKMEMGWFALIMINNLLYNILMNNVVIQSNFFPYGYIFSMSIEEDPYYNYLSSDQIKQLYLLYPHSGSYINILNISKAIVTIYNPYNIQVSNVSSGAFEQSLIVLGAQQNNFTYINFENLDIFGIHLSKPLYFLSNSPGVPNIQINVNFNKTLMSYINGFLFAYLQNANLQASSVYLDSNAYGNNTVIVFSSSGNANFVSCSFSNSILSSIKRFITAQNFNVLFENSLFLNLTEMFFSAFTSQISFRNCTFFSLSMGKSNYWADFSDSSFNFESSAILNMKSILTSQILFHFLSASNINITMKDVMIQKSQFYRVFQLESYVTSTNFNFTSIRLRETQGIFSGTYYNFLFLDCNVGSFNSLLVNYFEVIDAYNFQFFFMLAYFNKIEFNNVVLDRVDSISYYLFGILPISGATNIYNEMKLNNFTLKNIYYVRFLDINYVGNFGFLSISNSFFMNITYKYSIIDVKVRNQIFYLQTLKSFILNNTYINYERNSSFVSFFTLVSADNVTMQNSIMEGRFDNTKKEIPGLNAKSFLFFTFINNTILNLSCLTNPLDISDENGVITALASGGYFASNTFSTVIIRNNYFFGNIGNKYGVLSVVGATVVLMSNNTFITSSAYYGGAIAFYSIENLNITYLVIDSAIGAEGGGMYIYDITKELYLKEGTFLHLQAKNNGGGIELLQVNKAIFENLQGVDIKATQNGGFISLTNCFNTVFSGISAKNMSALSGGVFYIDSSEVEISSGLTKNTFVNSSGGVFFITGAETIVLIEKFDAEFSLSDSEGSILSSMNIRNLSVVSSNFSHSSVTTGGNGIINLLGFLIGDDNVGVFILQKINCEHNIASFGACLYYSSNNRLFLSGFASLNNSGSIFNVESDDVVELEFNDVSFVQSNYILKKSGNYEVISALNPLIVFINVYVKLNQWHLENNTAEAYLMKISSSTVVLLNSIFANFFSLNSDSSTYIRFLTISDSFVSVGNITMVYSFYERVDELCMFLEGRGTLFEVKESKFLNNSLLDVGALNFEESQVSIISSAFSSLSGSVAAVIIKTGNLTMENCNFSKNFNYLSLLDDDAADISFTDDDIVSSMLIISDSIFYVTSRNSLTVKKALQIIIESTIFMASFDNYLENSFARAIFSQDNLEINISSCIFSGFYAPLGSAIIFYQLSFIESINYIIINNSQFMNNIGNFGSVFYLLGSFHISIDSSNFSNNTAKRSNNLFAILDEDTGKGACLIADCEYYPEFSMNVSNCFFLNNTAENLGPSILCKSQNKDICFGEKNNKFTNNSDNFNYTKGFSSSPFKGFFISSRFTQDIYKEYAIKYENNNKLITDNILKDFNVSNYSIASGQPFDFSVLLTDSFNQLLTFESRATASLSCYYNNFTNSTPFKEVVFVDKGSTQIFGGIFNFSGVKIIFSPDNVLDCQMSVLISDNILFKSNLELGVNGTLDRTLNLPINLYLRNCIPGEILLEDHTCLACLKGTYLFDDPMQPNANKKCNICPENAYCQGGNQISPWEGYWRHSENSSLVIACPTFESCLGVGKNILNMMNLSNLTAEQKIQGVCHENYWGNLCYNCKQGYGRVKTNDNCEECATLWIAYTKMILSLIFMVTYIIIQAKIFIKIDKHDHSAAILLKLLLNHFQTISMISLVELGWTIDFNWFFTLQNYLSFLTEDFFIIDCFVQNIQENLLVQKIIFTIVLPIILSLLMISVWIIAFLFLLKKKKQTQGLKIIRFISKRMRITFLILIFILYPEILRKCFSLLNCLNIDDSVDYTVLSLSPNIHCWEGDHTLWVLAVSFPGLLVWGVISPLVILLIMIKFREKIQFYIYESHYSTFSQKSFTNKKQSKIVIKKILIEIDEYLKEKFFGKNGLPPKHEIKYKKGNIIFLESTEILCRDLADIIEKQRVFERKNKEKAKKEIKNNDQEWADNEKYITDPSALSEYLDFLEKIVNLNLNDEDLKTHVIRVQENFEEKEDDSLKNIEEKVMKVKKTNENKNDKDMARTAIVISNLGFLYRGYRPEYYYWEIVMFSRKFFLIFIGIFTEFFPKKTKPTMLIIILVGYMYAQIKFNPYQHPYLNKLESASLAVAFTTANIGILLFSDLLQNISVLFLLIVFSINFIYIIYWLKCLYEFGHVKEKFRYFVICWRYFKGKLIECLK